ncbi:MAG TPA: HAMP domain-containing sensor histidine kinase [Candidatus Saccharimonadales bacterium]|nr:HAMP domain-containing sensor histidine kinase [Candidatus Saccharimonadales bacterium]
MFRSAAVRLTGWYLALIMVLSIGTSIALYHVSSNRLEENAKRQVEYFSGLLGPENASDFAVLRHKQLEEDRDQLKGNLVIFNLLVLIGGGAASYGLSRRTLKPIEEALESQIRFTADASHELRTPITAIQTENEVALRNPKLSRTEAIGLLKSNLVEVGKLRDLSAGLLTLAYTDNDSDYSGEYAAADIIAKSKDRVAKAAMLKKITVSEPRKSDSLKIKGHEQKLVDLLAILLDNAIKYSPVESKIKITAKKHGKYIEISIADEGQGIKKEDLPNIFDRFYRADHSRNKQKAAGYGLGLAIAKKITDQHGGSIQVRSAVGKGSVFTARLPRA